MSAIGGTMNYKVKILVGSTYRVYEYPDDAEPDEWRLVFQGPLSDCESYIKLTEYGYMER